MICPNVAVLESQDDNSQLKCFPRRIGGENQVFLSGFGSFKREKMGQWLGY